MQRLSILQACLGCERKSLLPRLHRPATRGQRGASHQQTKSTARPRKVTQKLTQIITPEFNKRTNPQRPLDQKIPVLPIILAIFRKILNFQNHIKPLHRTRTWVRWVRCRPCNQLLNRDQVRQLGSHRNSCSVALGGSQFQL